MLNDLLTVLAIIGLWYATTGNKYRPACKAVEVAISDASKIHYPGEYDREQYRDGEARAHGWIGNPLYTKGEYHFLASSQESPACVVEPGTPEDVGKIVCSFHSTPSPPSLRRTAP